MTANICYEFCNLKLAGKFCNIDKNQQLTVYFFDIPKRIKNQNKRKKPPLGIWKISWKKMNSLTLPRWFGRKKRKEKETEKKKRQSVILGENPYENLQFLQPLPMASSSMSNGEAIADLDVNEAIRGCSGASEAVVQYRFHSTPLGDRSSTSPSRVDDYFDDDLYEDQHLSNSREGQPPRRSRPFSFDELSSQGQIWAYLQQGII